MRPPDDGDEEVLVRDEDACNMHRFYALSVDRDLFGQPILIVRWGRRGKRGNIRIGESGPRGEMRRRLVAIASRKILKGYRRLDAAGGVRTGQVEAALPLFD
jgi:predicted DNA-binding WGR domain protein